MSIGALDTRCRGTGFLRCLCAGDFCICDFHGQAECPGCVDCEWSDGDRDEYPEPEWDDEGAPRPSALGDGLGGQLVSSNAVGPGRRVSCPQLGRVAWISCSSNLEMPPLASRPALMSRLGLAPWLTFWYRGLGF